MSKVLDTSPFLKASKLTPSEFKIDPFSTLEHNLLKVLSHVESLVKKENSHVTRIGMFPSRFDKLIFYSYRFDRITSLGSATFKFASMSGNVHVAFEASFAPLLHYPIYHGFEGNCSGSFY